jgi:hypothetical protein
MPNMPHCRFENTVNNLYDCYDHLEDDPEDLNKYEKPARKNLIDICVRIAKEYGDLD